MDEQTNATGESAETDGLTIVTVPADKAQAVIDFVAGLASEEAEVSGHMISTGALGGVSGGVLAARMTTSTGCQQTVTGKFGYDMTCYDTDKITVP